MEEKYLTVKEVADKLSVHPRTIVRWCKEKKITHYKFNRDYRFKKQGVIEWIDSQLVSKRTLGDGKRG